MSLAAPVRRRQRVLVAATLVCAASMLALGGWAFLAPHSFSGLIDFAPYNEHLIHDAGAFQLGIGVAVLAALWWPDGLVVALTGFAVASGLHTLSHAIDRHLGGHASDVPSLGLLTLVLVAVYLRLQERKP
jgi:predicted anti-sigma-YlaC factor YlaD